MLGPDRGVSEIPLYGWMSWRETAGAIGLEKRAPDGLSLTGVATADGGGPGGLSRPLALAGEDLRVRMAEVLKHRRLTQPVGFPSAGCVFKNPPGASAGALIEQAGLKGLRVGGAQISEKHANWIVNLGSARAGEVLALVKLVEERVFEAFGIRLERELRILLP